MESGLSTVPAALAGNEQFNTLEKIKTALGIKAAEVVTNVEERIAIFDVALQYKDGGGVWRNVDPNHFPAGGVTAVLPCTESIRWAASQGIIGGCGNGMLGPNDSITREQPAVMLWRYAGSPAAADQELHFTDAGKASGYAPEALRWAMENGVMSGRGGASWTLRALRHGRRWRRCL